MRALKVAGLGLLAVMAAYTRPAQAQSCNPGLMFVLDRSGSMAETPFWTQQTGFVNFTSGSTAVTGVPGSGTGIGTITLSTGTRTVNGVLTQFTTQLQIGEQISVDGSNWYTIASISSDTALRVTIRPTTASAGQAFTYQGGAVTTFTSQLTVGMKVGTGSGTWPSTNPVVVGTVASITDDTHFTLTSAASSTTSGAALYGGDPNDKWQIVQAAVASATSTYSGKINFGLKTFEESGSCSFSAGPNYAVASGQEAAIVTTVNATSPGGTTPIDGVITAVSGYTDFATSVVAGDAPKFIVFMTDGTETCGGTTAHTVSTLTTLKNRGYQTFVIGFGADVDSDVMTQMATAGGTAKTSGTAYYQANSAADLNAAFSDITGIVFKSVNSGTSAATSGAPILSGSNQTWRVTAAYQVETVASPWHGFLRAVATDPSGNPVTTYNFHDIINTLTPSSRKIYTIDSSGVLANLSTVLTSDFASIVTTALATFASQPCVAHSFFDSTAQFYNMFSGGTSTYTSNTDCTDPANSAQLDTVNTYQANKLGDIEHSTPVIMSPPEAFINDASHISFASTWSQRPLTLFVGANDGMLHAFALEDDHRTSSTNEAGTELWNYVPRAVIPKLTTVSSHVEMVDAPPLVRDVQQTRGSASVSPSWSSVLIGSLGRGGNAWYALDVTDPLAPVAMWEHSSAEATFTSMGQAYGTASIGRVFYNNQEEPVAFLQGGWDPQDATRGKAVYIIDVFTGALVKRFDTSNVSGLDAAITGTPAAYDDGPGSFTSRTFVGDALGRVWRIDTSSSDITKWSMQRFWPIAGSSYDVATYQQPVFQAPSLAFDNAHKLLVMYGTGDLSNLGSTTQNMVWGVRENLTLAAVPTDPLVATATQAWSAPLLLQSSEKIVGDSVVFNGALLFSTYLPIASTCSAGSGRLYALDLTTGHGDLITDPNNPAAKIVAFNQSGTDNFLPLGPGLPSSPIIRQTVATATVGSNGSYSFSGGTYRALVQIGGAVKTDVFNDTTAVQQLGPVVRRSDILALSEYE